MPQPTFLALTLAALISGCGPSASPTDRLIVSPLIGSVDYRGNPAGGARVTLHPIAGPPAAAGLRPTATADADGQLRFTSYVLGDGVPPGEYDVSVIWPDQAYVPKNAIEKEAIQMGGEQPDKLRGRYASPQTTGLRVTVTDQPGQVLDKIELK